MLVKISKSKMSKVSEKRGNPIVAHLSAGGMLEPLCTASKPQDARWLVEGDPDWKATRDCKNCVGLAARLGVRERVEAPPRIQWRA